MHIHNEKPVGFLRGEQNTGQTEKWCLNRPTSVPIIHLDHLKAGIRKMGTSKIEWRTDSIDSMATIQISVLCQIENEGHSLQRFVKIKDSKGITELTVSVVVFQGSRSRSSPIASFARILSCLKFEPFNDYKVAYICFILPGRNLALHLDNALGIWLWTNPKFNLTASIRWWKSRYDCLVRWVLLDRTGFWRRTISALRYPAFFSGRDMLTLTVKSLIS